jgi:multidrug efflux pump subunit AcrB
MPCSTSSVTRLSSRPTQSLASSWTISERRSCAAPVHFVGACRRRIASLGATRRRANRSLPGLIDVTTGSEQGALQSKVTIDRVAASRLGVQVQDIDNALNNAFAQRQVSTIYTERNQYRVILELSPRFQGDPSNLEKVYVAGAGEGGPECRCRA